jgi:U3 small nucleolar RNA-associated protein 11
MSRRNHKERAQPLHRQKLGLLEKHKDYVHRARDYKSKKDRLKNLREKAAFRNKEEFYWGMIKGRTKNGVAIADRGNEALSTDVVRLLKTQDVGYIKMQIAQDEKVGRVGRGERSEPRRPQSGIAVGEPSHIVDAPAIAAVPRPHTMTCPPLPC